MDIDDILASVDQPDISSPESTALDHQLLTRFWVAERGVPELLPWPGPLMDRTMDRVRRQVETIETLASTPTTTNTHNPTLNLKLSILQTDLSRTQYLLRSILRQRLSKLTKYSMHYLLLISGPPPALPNSQSNSQSTQQNQGLHVRPEQTLPTPDPSLDPTKTSPLSPQEAQYLHAHQTLLASHFGTTFLNAFPAQLRRLDDNVGGTSMVQPPENREVVFVRCLVGEVRVVAPPGDGVEEELEGVVMRMGDVWVVRWEGVKAAWERGEVEVL